MRFNIGFKIFGIAIGLLALMVVAALLGLRMTRTVDDQLGEAARLQHEALVLHAP